MNTAHQFHELFEALDITEDGFKSQTPWVLLVSEARSCSISTDAELSWKSGGSDCTEELTFRDGSKLMILNPRQRHFSGFTRILSAVDSND
jgi:hypothetical protein